ncbi:hypothetical protein IWZ03DRAFT_439047 [Phyllosticta citriasiana]|uniref:Uncharacterized protein n=1 Tax=Phyllosticta citriasiana TaxID=595635 RepID=A0ABR1KPG2_9PEZI
MGYLGRRRNKDTSSHLRRVLSQQRCHFPKPLTRAQDKAVSQHQGICARAAAPLTANKQHHYKSTPIPSQRNHHHRRRHGRQQQPPKRNPRHIAPSTRANQIPLDAAGAQKRLDNTLQRRHPSARHRGPNPQRNAPRLDPAPAQRARLPQRRRLAKRRPRRHARRELAPRARPPARVPRAAALRPRRRGPRRPARGAEPALAAAFGAVRDFGCAAARVGGRVGGGGASGLGCRGVFAVRGVRCASGLDQVFSGG